MGARCSVDVGVVLRRFIAAVLVDRCVLEQDEKLQNEPTYHGFLSVRNMVFFELFLRYFSRLSMSFYPSHVPFSQFHSSRKDNTRVIELMT